MRAWLSLFRPLVAGVAVAFGVAGWSWGAAPLRGGRCGSRGARRASAALSSWRSSLVGAPSGGSVWRVAFRLFPLDEYIHNGVYFGSRWSLFWGCFLWVLLVVLRRGSRLFRLCLAWVCRGRCCPRPRRRLRFRVRVRGLARVRALRAAWCALARWCRLRWRLGRASGLIRAMRRCVVRLRVFALWRWLRVWRVWRRVRFSRLFRARRRCPVRSRCCAAAWCAPVFRFRLGRGCSRFLVRVWRLARCALAGAAFRPRLRVRLRAFPFGWCVCRVVCGRFRPAGSVSRLARAVAAVAGAASLALAVRAVHPFRPPVWWLWLRLSLLRLSRSVLQVVPAPRGAGASPTSSTRPRAARRRFQRLRLRAAAAQPAAQRVKHPALKASILFSAATNAATPLMSIRFEFCGKCSLVVHFGRGERHRAFVAAHHAARVSIQTTQSTVADRTGRVRVGA